VDVESESRFSSQAMDSPLTCALPQIIYCIMDPSSSIASNRTGFDRTGWRYYSHIYSSTFHLPFPTISKQFLHPSFEILTNRLTTDSRCGFSDALVSPALDTLDPSPSSTSLAAVDVPNPSNTGASSTTVIAS
jgi:hypothetical protein